MSVGMAGAEVAGTGVARVAVTADGAVGAVTAAGEQAARMKKRIRIMSEVFLNIVVISSVGKVFLRTD